MMKDIRYNIINVVLSLLLLASCSSNDDLGKASSDYLAVNNVSMTGNEQTAIMLVEADCSWSISADATWLTISPIEGSNTTEVTLTTGANPSALQERTCQISVVSAGGVSRQVTLTQSAATEQLSLSTNAINNVVEGGEQYLVTVTSNTTWSVTTSAAWVTVDKTEGANTDHFTVSVAATDNEEPRNATVTVTSATSRTSVITISQVGKIIELNVAPEQIQATAKAASYQFNITGNAIWTITPNVDIEGWMVLSARQGEGPTAITITILADNTQATPRSASFAVRSQTGKIERTVTITQAGSTEPELTTPTTSGVGRYEATVSTTFTSSLNVTAAGFCYATHDNPTTADHSVTADVQGQSGTFSAQLAGLESGTTYYVRAYAVNGRGTSYSPTVTFRTTGSVPGEDENPTPNL